MVSYAEHQFECRRKLMLRYFQEDFDPAQCHKTCDNCKARGGDGCGAERVDRAPLACKVLALLDQTRAKLTLGMLVDALKVRAWARARVRVKVSQRADLRWADRVRVERSDLLTQPEAARVERGVAERERLPLPQRGVVGQREQLLQRERLALGG